MGGVDGEGERNEGVVGKNKGLWRELGRKRGDEAVIFYLLSDAFDIL